MKSSCWQGGFLLEALREIPSLASLQASGSFWQLPAILGIPWFADGCLRPLPPDSTWPSPLFRSLLSTLYSPSRLCPYKDTCHWIWGPPR